MTINLTPSDVVQSDADDKKRRERGDYLDDEGNQEESNTVDETPHDSDDDEASTENETPEGESIGQPNDGSEGQTEELTNEQLLDMIEELKANQKPAESPEPKLTPDALAAALVQAEEAKAQAAAAKASKEAASKPPQYDLKAAQAKLASAVQEGDIEAVTAIQAEMMSAQQELMTWQMNQALDQTKQETAAATMRQLQEAEFEKLTNKLVSDNPIFNPENEAYSSEVVDIVNTQFAGHLANGMTKAKALEKAVNTVLPLFTKQESETAPTLGDTRKTTAKKRAAEAVKQQPSSKQTGSGSHDKDHNLTESDIMKMSSKDFKNLPASMLAKLRGDIV